MTEEREKYGELWIGPNHWTIWLCDSDDPALDEAEGVTYHKTSTILMDRGLEDSRFVAVLGHEVVHLLTTNGNNELLSSIYMCDAAHVDKVTENLAAYLGPHILDGFQRSGWLKLPKRPK